MIGAKRHWVQEGSTYISGFTFYKGKRYEATEFAALIDALSAEDFVSLLQELIGNFAVVTEKNGVCIACIDLIRSVPLFYKVESEVLYISDDISCLPNWEEPLAQAHLEEYLAAGFVLGHNTLLENVFQIQAGEYIKWDETAHVLSRHDYYMYNLLEPITNRSEKQLFEELDAVHDAVARRLVESLDGRQVVVPLSGGFDSRLVVQMLKKAGHKNVVCFTYGGKNSAECRYSREIASSLGYQWHYIEQKRRTWKQLARNPLIKGYLEDVNNLAVIPYIQHIPGIYHLLSTGKIEKDCIAVTGNSGDFLEGKNIHAQYLAQSMYEQDDVANLLLHQHFILNGSKPFTSPSLKARLPVAPHTYLTKDAIALAECFGWRERQAKYVASDQRSYELFGLEWRLPLWDKELMDFWGSIPVEQRADRKLYYQYVRNEKIGNANEITRYQRIATWIKEKLPAVASVALLASKLIEYWVHPYQWGGLVPFHTYARAVFRARGKSGFSICSVLAGKVISDYQKNRRSP